MATAQEGQKVTKAEVMMDLVGYVAKAESEMDTYVKSGTMAPGTNEKLDHASLQTQASK